ncbi:hypothetical protein [Pseudoalteromonas sp. XMcav11-Q]|uniref:hypothetical protein n=1 Tax=Pseudoalteromonas sp. XMcav11-Q TaxID=3136665 RepID=UPI0032C42F0A
MTRRSSYTKVEKYNRLEGLGNRKGDFQYKAMNCPNTNCDNFLYFPAGLEYQKGFQIDCCKCGYRLEDGKFYHIYDYDLKHIENNEIIESGEFLISHRELVQRARFYKYCIICHSLKPNEDFDNHGSRKTGRQGECNHCKQIYNGIKNQTRITEQHREASRNREFFKILSEEGTHKLDQEALMKRYNYCCLGCDEPFFDRDNRQRLEIHWDHLLPSKYLWPLVDFNTTPLCKACNLEKSAKWPDQFYTQQKLRTISAISGIKFDILNSSVPVYYPEALNSLQNPNTVFKLLESYGPRYRREIIRLDKRIQSDTGFSFLRIAVDEGMISSSWLE